ncbi:hypothetical protein [Desulfonatronum sp. SC1]|uniref:hypothetical protein n=1 Tax=Desulfonatronum sp. SC1 TaxID=2109626 RepID=UPI0011B21DF4|nr:hypothetical protein [Desulfonatronum sp. SC1]
MPRFEIIGTGKETGRKRKRIYFAFDEHIARKNAEDDGTVVEEIKLLPYNPPTEQQIELAAKHNIDISSGTNENDVADIINAKFKNEILSKKEDKDIARFFNIEVTEFIGEDTLYSKIKNALSKPGYEKELVLFFAYCVYRDYIRGSSMATTISLNDPAIEYVARKLHTNSKVVNSIKKYDGNFLKYFGEKTSNEGYTKNYGSKRTEAYKSVIELLKEKAMLPGRSTNEPIITKKDLNVSPMKPSNTTKRKKLSTIEIVSIVVVAVVLLYIFSR